MKWDDYYKIVMSDSENWDDPITYKILRAADHKVIGEYKDFKYAKKQAKYKFKRMMANVEKILLT